MTTLSESIVEKKLFTIFLANNPPQWGKTIIPINAIRVLNTISYMVTPASGIYIKMANKIKKILKAKFKVPSFHTIIPLIISSWM